MTGASARLTELLPAVATAVGAPTTHQLAWSLPSAEAYVVVLVDGLGEILLREHSAQAPFLSTLTNVEAVCEIPSTTATSLTSLGTGLSPSRHGVVGYTSRIPGTDRLLNALDWDPAVDALQWQPCPTLFEHLDHAGIATSVVGPAAFAHSGLTRASQRGARYLGAATLKQRASIAVAQSRKGPAVTYVYEGDLDSTGHRHGVESTQWRAQLSSIDAELERLRDVLPDHVRLVVTADHGMVDAQRRFNLDSVAELRRDVVLLGGEARLRHLYCVPGTESAVAQRWRDHLGDADAVVKTYEQACEAGWFGDVREGVRGRIGDVVVASLGDFAVMSPRDFPREDDLVGMHGSITDVERMIPIRWC